MGTKLSSAVGSNNELISKNGVALYRDEHGNEGVLIGTPNGGNTHTVSKQCYVLALNQRNGEVIFKLALTPNGANNASSSCQTDGFVVDSHFAYGGIYPSSNATDCRYHGEMIKIDL